MPLAGVGRPHYVLAEDVMCSHCTLWGGEGAFMLLTSLPGRGLMPLSSSWGEKENKHRSKYVCMMNMCVWWICVYNEYVCMKLWRGSYKHKGLCNMTFFEDKYTHSKSEMTANCMFWWLEGKIKMKPYIFLYIMISMTVAKRALTTQK